MGVNLLAIAWGVTEASVFFIVPDILLTYLVLKAPRRAAKACLWVLVGSLVGGTAMFCWGNYDLKGTERFLIEIPAIDEELLNKVEQQIENNGVKATFFGPIAGRPYKIYAVYAGAKDISFPSFLLVSIPARLLRFILLTWITWWVASKLLTKLQARKKAFVLTAVWIAFYSWYFAIM